MTTLALVIGRGLAADRPTFGIAGRLYYSTDTGTLERDSGSAWESVDPGSAPPSGAAGGVLAGSYPDPTFAADMATQSELNAALATAQPLDGDLTAIAGLTATTDNVIQSVGSAWASRTPAQLKATLALVKGDVGLGNVDNTSNATERAAAATLTNKTLTAPVIGDFTNAGHDHLDADDGGTLSAAAIASGLIDQARLGSGSGGAGTKVLYDDQTYKTPSSGFANPMTTAGDLIVGDTGGAAIRLGKGSDGQVLTVDPTTHLLIWATPSGGGAALTVEEVDGSPTDAAIVKLVFPNGSVGIASHVATIAFPGFANPMTTEGDIIVGGSSGTPGRKAIGAAGQIPRVNSGATGLDYGYETVNVVIPIGDGTNVIATGLLKFTLECPWAGYIEQWTIYGEGSGSIVLDIWKDTYANYPATVADTITASAKPTISAAIKNQDSTLTGWTRTFAAGDGIKVNVDSVTTFAAVTLVLRMRRTA